MQEGKKELVLVFPDDWISYSPTVINLVNELLGADFIVKIIAFDSSKYKEITFNKNPNLSIQFLHVKNDTFLLKAGAMFERYLNQSMILISRVKFFKRIRNIEWFNSKTFFFEKKLRVLRSALRQQKSSIIIGVDNLGVLAATSIGKKVHFLSLEISRDIFYYRINWKLVRSLIIQTKERMQYLTNGVKFSIPTYFIQNSPSYNSSINPKKENEYSLLYMGNMGLEYNGIIQMIKSLYLLPSKYALYIKAPVNVKSENFIYQHFPDLVGCRLFIDNSYTDNEDIINFVSRFSIGFSFYDIGSLSRPTFNVISCPSGKLFNYYNAGIPVIGNKIIGLNSISEFNSGIQIDTISELSIADAVLEIEKNYSIYSLNSRKAAKAFDFRKGASAFINDLLKIN